ncbi:hypothetical protein DOTSEDRAFT_28091 [Dothistroma septosporum NZE10]|uniref:Nucleoporin Pom152 n=1 Tax=Dothistroma septosporum (strain NZE10 / CBS 128990) TaxID=675120 RepID=N1PCH1_DOTSN|nr:hypothetical protein DOTSEDRAFT_28091 [Dothistroma septosporum NZE10]
MDTPQTPRMRGAGAYPETPLTTKRAQRPAQYARPSPNVQRERLPSIPTLRSQQQPASPPGEPLIPEHIIDAPSQRLYAVAIWVALWTWRIYDFTGLQESEEQSLWLFMKWVAMDGIFLFGLPSMRIPWLEWNPATMTLLFLAHAFADGMLMFRVPIPLGAGLAVLWRGVWGAYETAVNEHNVNPNAIMFNESLILGRQVIHILPEGSAVLNPRRDAFCVDGSRTDVKLPITINATSPIAIDILRVDLETQANETLHISKSQIKTLHKEASRLLSYSDKPNEPKTLYYTVKKPGLYVLAKVLDESNLEVSRKRLAHTVVVPCPKAEIVATTKEKCKGETANVDLRAVGTPPMRIKYRKFVNKNHQDITSENIQPDDFFSPLSKQDQNSLVVPNRVETEWAKTRSVSVPISESLATSGKWSYAIEEIVDGFGNKVSYTGRDEDEHGRYAPKVSNTHQIFNVHERPNVVLNGCTPQRPLKVAKGSSATLPLVYGSTGKGEIQNATYHLEYRFAAEDSLSATAERNAIQKVLAFPPLASGQKPQVQRPGLYTLTGISTEHCSGDVREPASCLLENPPQPTLAVSSEAIYDKCAGSSIGLRADLDLAGTPPFDIQIRMTREGERHHSSWTETINGLRGQLELTPKQAGKYTYEFYSVSDAVYKDQTVQSQILTQEVKPSASAAFVRQDKQTMCIGEQASWEVALVGDAPFRLEYEVVHNGKRTKNALDGLTEPTVKITTGPLHDGGEYTLTLVSITDTVGCKEFLKAEAKVAVRHQKPKASFGQIEGRRIVNTLEGKQIALPLRLAGEAPWTVKFLDKDGHQQIMRASSPNDRLAVDQAGIYELQDVSDNFCPGVVDPDAKQFQVDWIARPELRLAQDGCAERKGNTCIKADVCEGDDDAVEVLFKGAPPFEAAYVQHVKPEKATVAPKNKNLRAALNVASLRMDTQQAGTYDYKFSTLGDSNYDPNAKHFSPLTIQQRVHSRPSAAFTNPGKTYSFCSVESEGEEVIPVTLHGQPPFELEVEIKHHGSIKPEIVSYNNIASTTHNIRIPHSRLHLGKSAVSLRRISDARGCARTLDSTIPRVQISVHDAPTITPLEIQTDYCVGDRINFGLSGVAPFQVFYTFEGHQRKATVSSGNTFRRLAEKPGTFAITGLQDSASSCRASTNLTKHIHGMPSVRVSNGRDSYVDIHEGGEAEILFEFGGVPPFEFTYIRSSNTEKGAKKKGTILDMRSEISDERSMRIFASEEGTYEVVAIKDAFCAYSKPGIKVESDKRKRLQY